MTIRSSCSTDRRPARRAGSTPPHGPVETPVFMPVGTQATVKGLTPDQLRGRRGADHPRQHLSPDPAARRRTDRATSAGCTGSWTGTARSSPTPAASRSSASPSIAQDHRRTAATFRSHIDGALLELTPGAGRRHPGEPRLRHRHGASTSARPATPPDGACATPSGGRSCWAERCQRRPHAGRIRRCSPSSRAGPTSTCGPSAPRRWWRWTSPATPWAASASARRRRRCTRPCRPCAALLPADKPRYLMGVGRPEDLLAGVAAGIDLFDCVHADPQRPQRPGVHRRRRRSGCGTPSTSEIRPRWSPVARATRCRHFSRAYLHHLFAADEMLGPTLLSLHNVAYLPAADGRRREAIEAGRFAAFRAGCLARWGEA